MVRQIRYGRLVASSLIGIALVSCGSDNPAAPTPTPGPVSVQRIDVSGPDSIPPGETGQFTATALKSDGSTENVTTTATWTTNNSRAITAVSGGTVRANSPGEAVITARYQNRGASKPVLAVPTGTYKLSGRITEGAVAVPAVSLTVTRGIGEGLTATSGVDGRFALYGVAGEVRVQASKVGYRDTIRDLRVESTMTDNFEIVPARAPKDLSGTYSLTMTAGSCSSTFPNDVRTRSYTATITQSGRALTVKLEGATFIVNGGRGDQFSGTIDPADNVAFTIGSFYYYYYFSSEFFDLVERLDDTRAFSVVGTATAKVNGSEIAGTIYGAFVTLSTAQHRFSPQSSCFSATHTIVMRPR